MYYPASTAIATEHPDLADLVLAIDGYLRDVEGLHFRLDPAADIVRTKPGVLARLLALYADHGVVECAQVMVCPKDGEFLETDEDGALWCDICETTYQSGDCRKEEAYRTLQDPRAPSIAIEGDFERGYALLIGIGKYDNLSRLEKTVVDAKDLYDLLTDPARAGYPRDHVRLLLDKQASKGAISNALDDLAHRVGPDDTVVISISGHGAQRIGGFEPGEYLCPVDADSNNLRSTAISTDEFTTALRALKAGRVAVFLDTCHSGGVGAPREAGAHVKAGLSDTGYSQLATGRGRVIIASCHPDEVSWELPGMRNGLFTHYLLEGLQGEAASSDGAVHILDLYKYISERVPKHRKDQHPLLKVELESDFAITIASRE